MSELSLKRIGVIMGGVSSEREISLKSGQAVLTVLRKRGLDAVKIDLNTDEKEGVKEIIIDRDIDAAFIALHGYFGEDGKIQAVLDELNIPYTGSDSRASYLAMDKVASRQIFEEFGLTVPRYKVAYKINDLKNLGLNYPLVVKPSSNGSSIGLTIVDSNNDLLSAFESAKKYDEVVIVEEYIKGREMTVGVLGEEALPLIEIIPRKRFFDFEAKYQKGLTEYIVPAQVGDNLNKKIQHAGLRAHQLLGCFGFSRVDVILDNDKVYILEVNSIPGMTETSLLPKAASSKGISFDELCMRILKLALNRERMINAIKEE